MINSMTQPVLKDYTLSPEQVPLVPSLALPEAERQHMVARALVGVQAEVVSRHGFEGDTGYAQAQVCLMEHASDADADELDV